MVEKSSKGDSKRGFYSLHKKWLVSLSLLLLFLGTVFTIIPFAINAVHKNQRQAINKHVLKSGK